MGCGRGGKGAATRMVRVQDAAGREVSVPFQPRRVVTLNKNAAEVMRLLGVADSIVGVSDWIPKNPEYWPELTRAVDVGKFNDPNIEAIAALRPDLVLCYQSSPGPGFEEKMAAAGIPVLRLELYRIGSLPRDVEQLGRIFGRENEARRYLDWLKIRMDDLVRRVAADPARPNVYLEAYADFAACGGSSGMQERAAFAGARNIASGMLGASAPVSPEWVLRHQPFAVIKMSAQNGCYAKNDTGRMPAQRAAMLARPGWDRIPAGQSGRVYLMTTDVTSGPASVVGLAWMVKWLHPATSADLDPNAWHRDFVERFQGRPWRGVYVCPDK